MNSRTVDYMRLFWFWVQRNHLELDEVQREIHHKDPRVFVGTQRPGVKSLNTQGSVSLCLCVGVKHLSLLLNPPCLSPWNLFSPWLQYTCDSQTSLAVHSAPSQTSAPGESTCANLPPPPNLLMFFIEYLLCVVVSKVSLQFYSAFICISNLEHENLVFLECFLECFQECLPWFPPILMP